MGRVTRTKKPWLRFTGGELSPLLDARSDVEAASGACRTLENMIMQPQGGVVRRPGLRFINFTVAGEANSGTGFVTVKILHGFGYTPDGTNTFVIYFRGRMFVYANGNARFLGEVRVQKRAGTEDTALPYIVWLGSSTTVGAAATVAADIPSDDEWHEVDSTIEAGEGETVYLLSGDGDITDASGYDRLTVATYPNGALFPPYDIPHDPDDLIGAGTGHACACSIDGDELVLAGRYRDMSSPGIGVDLYTWEIDLTTLEISAFELHVSKVNQVGEFAYEHRRALPGAGKGLAVFVGWGPIGGITPSSKTILGPFF